MSENIVVFTCTYYASTTDVRFACCLALLEEAATQKTRIIVLDGSPSEEVRQRMRQCGSSEVVRVHKQQAKGKKGAALREALAIARDVAASQDAWLCWQEPEKVDMMRHWPMVATSVCQADIAVPQRDETLFRETYPIEQFHSESFANLYVASAAQTFAGFADYLDWHFGPFALRAKHADLWLSHDGELWDAQVIPIIHAIHAGLVVKGVSVPFRAPAVMKQQEERNFAFVEKRLMQINFLDPKLVTALKQGTQSAS